MTINNTPLEVEIVDVSGGDSVSIIDFIRKLNFGHKYLDDSKAL